MRRFPADLYVHMALSPCASAETTSAAVVERVRGLGPATKAACDHSPAGNVHAAQAAAGGSPTVMLAVETAARGEARGDRKVLSVAGRQAGLPEGLALDAVGSASPGPCVPAAPCGLPAVSAIEPPDARCFNEIGGRGTLPEMRGPTFEESALALEGRGRGSAVA